MTDYSVIYDQFKYRVERDAEFFEYLNLLPDIAEYVVEQRCASLLNEAAAMFSLACPGSAGLMARSDDKKQFTADLNQSEIFILAALMYQQYMARDVAKIKTLNVNYTSTDLRVFDPSNARESFLALYEKVCLDNERLIDAYNNTDREKGGYLTIDYSAFTDNEE